MFICDTSFEKYRKSLSDATTLTSPIAAAIVVVVVVASACADFVCFQTSVRFFSRNGSTIFLFKKSIRGLKKSLLLVELTDFSHLESREIEKMNGCLNVKARQFPDWLLNKRKKIKSN